VLSYLLLLPRPSNGRRAPEFQWLAIPGARVSKRLKRLKTDGLRRAANFLRQAGAPAERLGFVRLHLSEDQMAHAWNIPIFAIATVYFTVDALFSAITAPITAWLSRRKLLERVRHWVTSLGPYQSFALFAVPVIILEPTKPLSAYLLGTGHFLPGATVFIAAGVLKLTVVERLFQLNKKKLLSIPLFAWGYGYWRRMMDFLESTSAWQTARRVLSKALERRRSRLRSRFRSAKASRAN